ncbi:citramalate synthase [Pleionea sediminis]|uniref:citramalate synthase n=1 Tax=Pleionea sediminis TaxID=2569479 RepID=UPI001186F009|nr:citramalate synthase [Pleionea sediminis]
MQNLHKGSSKQLLLYDTTLRDGAQMQSIQFSADDKVAIARRLDEFGMDYIELGWPGANPVDDRVFRTLKQSPLKNSKSVAFGATCKPNKLAEDDPLLAALIKTETPVVTLVAKSSRFHIEKILETTIEENLRMIFDSVQFLKRQGREVWIDAEHFFDGFDSDCETAMACLSVAERAGAEGVVLCDTNGGALPSRVAAVTHTVIERLRCRVGIHAHNDCELAVANALAAIEAGAEMVQGTINGYGERCGNTNLVSLIPTLQLKTQAMNKNNAQLETLTDLSRTVSNRCNFTPDPFAPYVGQAAFAHKAGFHASAVGKYCHSYEHIEPSLVGNERRILVSQQAGRSNLKHKLSKFNINTEDLTQALSEVKAKEAQGFQYEEGDASLDLLLRKQKKSYQSPFRVEELMVHCIQRVNSSCESSAEKLTGNDLHQASVKVVVNDHAVWSAAEGNGPVEAIDKALREALTQFWPNIPLTELTDYKVRILNPGMATAATTHVWIESHYQGVVWNTIGCSPNILEASQQALCDSLEYFILNYGKQSATFNEKRGMNNGNQAA